ncbi:hypothetical protein DFH94DRAFT_780310 [Russula ochroleuca]|jgi:hypothetical protein|uniref:BTB domain-containing protein n=1 Tax=Russula ochroleuca TaxID=152965 RepID=A0A9P5MPY3_9AGAM|nr:hypothetical protein DFH94DRAFT_780310 [Russula ochroleuca]
MTEPDTPLFIPPEDEGFFVKQDLEEGVSAAQLLHSPPRKRARNLFEKAEFMKIPQCQGSEIVRDEDYYLSDGSCIILVENTLFNVHRTMLSKDSSSFGTMFSLPQGDKLAEGQSDDNPVILAGDTVSEFRNFLWALYALPHELLQVHSNLANLTRLIDIASISNKYSFKSLETWSLDVIVDTVTRRGSSSPQFPLAGLCQAPTSPTQTYTLPAQLTNNEQIVALVRLAQMCQHERLLNTMVESLRRHMVASPQNAYMAMTLADELDLRVLRGAAYLEVMQKAVAIVRQPGSGHVEGEVDADGRLVVSATQQMRLLSGYYRLTMAWEQLRTVPPNFDHAPSCGVNWHQSGCMQSWQEFWREKSKSETVLALGLADVLGRLRAVLKEFDKWGSATYMHHDCRMLARRAINEKLKAAQDALPDLFSDVD